MSSIGLHYRVKARRRSVAVLANLKSVLERNLAQIVKASLVLGLFMVAWLQVAPVQFGGRMSYVMTDGHSMLPRYRQGDVMILRKQASYHIGEVAAYHNRELNTVVMHRITAVSGGHYQFKGDSNTWTDSYRPTASEIIGAEWFHIRGGARYVMQVRRPAVAAGALAGLWILSLRPVKKDRRRLWRRRTGVS